MHWDVRWLLLPGEIRRKERNKMKKDTKPYWLLRALVLGKTVGERAAQQKQCEMGMLGWNVPSTQQRGSRGSSGPGQHGTKEFLWNSSDTVVGQQQTWPQAVLRLLQRHPEVAAGRWPQEQPRLLPQMGQPGTRGWQQLQRDDLAAAPRPPEAEVRGFYLLWLSIKEILKLWHFCSVINIKIPISTWEGFTDCTCSINSFVITGNATRAGRSAHFSRSSTFHQGTQVPH